jgi:hypothetical protein
MVRRKGINPGGISVTGGGSVVEGVTDHGQLTGLTDDDHTQYVKETDLNAKGDIYVATANDTLTVVSAGTNGYVLTANSGVAAGVEWAEPAGSAGWITDDLAIVDQPITSSYHTIFQLTAHADAHTKGDYTELVASTSDDVTMVRITFGSVSGTGASTGVLVDLATGSAASEDVKAANLNAGFVPAITATGTNAGSSYWLPLAIPSGTRIAARCQAETGLDTVDVMIQTFSGSNQTATAIDTIGAVTASSRGTNVTGGNNAEGNWTEIEDSTAETYTGLLWGFGGAGNSSMTGGGRLVDIGTGAAAAETAIISNLAISTTSAEALMPPLALPIYGVSIASGTRLSARVQNNAGTNATDIILYGLR